MSPASMRRTRSALLCTSRCFIASIMAKAPPPSSTHCSSASAASASSAVLRLDHVRAGEQVVVLEQVGLEGEHLLDAQRPLLVPRAGQPERLVPRRQLHRARPGVLRERHAERLEHDALHVVLGLRLGEPERVHLHAVAEPAQLLVGHAVALGGDAVPQRAEGAELAHLLDEADPGVHEERDAARRPRGTRRRSTWPDSRTASSTSIAVASAYATSSTGVAPASCRWYEQTLIGFHFGTCRTAWQIEVDGEPARRLGPEDVGAARRGTP